MRRFATSVAIIGLGVLLAHPAYPCGFAPGYGVFQLGPVLRPTTTLAPAPEVTAARIERGYDGGDASCSDAGVLVLKVPSNRLGYRFELAEGSFDDTVFPEEFVRPIRGGELRFVWLDGKRNWQEEINVLVKVTSITSTGVVSEPALVRIQHPGGARARNRTYKQLQRNVTPNRWRAASAPFHDAHAARCHAAAELRRYA